MSGSNASRSRCRACGSGPGTRPPSPAHGAPGSPGERSVCGDTTTPVGGRGRAAMQALRLLTKLISPSQTGSGSPHEVRTVRGSELPPPPWFQSLGIVSLLRNRDPRLHPYRFCAQSQGACGRLPHPPGEALTPPGCPTVQIDSDSVYVDRTSGLRAQSCRIDTNPPPPPPPAKASGAHRSPGGSVRPDWWAVGGRLQGPSSWA